MNALEATNFDIFHGDSCDLDLRITLDGAPYYDPAMVVVFTVRESHDAVSPLLELTNSGGIALLSSAQSRWAVQIPASAVSTWPLHQSLPYDVELRTPGGGKRTVAYGFFFVYPDVTKS